MIAAWWQRIRAGHRRRLCHKLERSIALFQGQSEAARAKGRRDELAEMMVAHAIRRLWKANQA